VLVRLSELMFVEVVRRCHAEPSATRGGWLAGLRDPLVGQALALLHRHSAAAWTLASLAAEVGISRSRLAESFRSACHRSSTWPDGDYSWRRACSSADRQKSRLSPKT
jgi:transcriptional regulator GlxA family with amidase domain